MKPELDIPKLLQEKYPNWLIRFPEIYQIDDNGTIIKVWSSKKEIIDYYHKYIQALDSALRKCCRFNGFFWIIKILYDKEDIRPVFKEKRNQSIYAYNPPIDICENPQAYTFDDFLKDEIRSRCELIGKFENSVMVGQYLDLSVTNIRRVAKQQDLLLHKDYFFTFEPLYQIHKVLYILKDYYSKITKLKEEDKKIFKENILLFKELYVLNCNRIISSEERDMYIKVQNYEK